MNYFEWFELRPQIRVDQAQLMRQYLKLQKQYHPDFYTQEGAGSQEEALEKSAALNKGLKILKDPDATLFYLLELKGMASTDEKYQLPPDFLMEVMELNESLSAESLPDIQGFENNLYQEVKALIEGYDDDAVTREQLEQLKAYYYKKKYLQRILERMEG